jgi:hypothetical protein
MADISEKDSSTLAGNLNLGRGYLITKLYTWCVFQVQPYYGVMLKVWLTSLILVVMLSSLPEIANQNQLSLILL